MPFCTECGSWNIRSCEIHFFCLNQNSQNYLNLILQQNFEQFRLEITTNGGQYDRT